MRKTLGTYAILCCVELSSMAAHLPNAGDEYRKSTITSSAAPRSTRISFVSRRRPLEMKSPDGVFAGRKGLVFVNPTRDQAKVLKGRFLIGPDEVSSRVDDRPECYLVRARKLKFAKLHGYDTQTDVDRFPDRPPLAIADAQTSQVN